VTAGRGRGPEAAHPDPRGHPRPPRQGARAVRQGIKTLSLFFIDEVAKYRDYDREDTLGEYARVFEEEYEAVLADQLGQLDLDEAAEGYRKHVEAIPVRKTHEGYFSIDKKTGRSVDGKIAARGDFAGQSDDVDAYDLILKDKERLLSFEEPVRFIWSHSALREGWDNPNVFVMGMLKKSDNTTTRRQEIGRGLRLSVDQHGERMDNPVTVHDINELTVVTDESYTDFVTALQKEIIESLSARPRKASVDYFTGKQIKLADGSTSVLEKSIAQALYNHLIRHDYIDDDGLVTQAYKDARADGTLAAPTSEALKPVIDFVWPLVDALYLDIPKPTDGRKPKKIPFNEANFKKREFQELWGRINHKAVYQVEFDSDELIKNCIRTLDKSLNVTVMQYLVEAGKQVVGLEVEQLEAGTGFKVSETKVEHSAVSAGSTVKYDLLGEIAEKTQLTRRTCAAILTGIHPGTFAKFKQNPEQFITEAARLINEQKATVIVEHLTYDPLDNRYDSSIFTENQTAQDLSKAGDKLQEERLRVRRDRLQGRAVVRRAARRQRRGRRLLQVAARLLHPDPRRRLQPRLGHRLPRRHHENQTRLLRRRDQGLNVHPPAQGRRERQDRVRPEVLRVPRQQRGQVRRRHRLHRAHAASHGFGVSDV
jgi:type III restriction enzyme